MWNKPKHFRRGARLLLLSCLLAAGCASYTVPGGGANMEALGVSKQLRESNTDGLIRRAFDKKPLAAFPTAIAVVRVQSPGYTSPTAQGWGEGRYSIVTTRDVETPQQINRLAKLPMVNGIAPINRLLLPARLESDMELRQAAAQLQADVLVIYTLDTHFTTEDKAAPLSVVTLGLSPNQQVRVTSTASGVVMDTRNGYIYGLAEATEHQNRMASAWQNEVAIDETRRATETVAFDKLVGELETTWRGVVSRYAPGHAAVQ